MLGKFRSIISTVYAMCSFDKNYQKPTLELKIVAHFILNDVKFDFNVAYDYATPTNNDNDFEYPQTTIWAKNNIITCVNKTTKNYLFH